MAIIYVLLPYLILPFFVAYAVGLLGGKKKWSYLLIASFVPLWPLFLVQVKALPQDGVVFAGTSILLIPIVLFIQYLANRLMKVRGTSPIHNL